MQRMYLTNNVCNKDKSNSPWENFKKPALNYSLSGESYLKKQHKLTGVHLVLLKAMRFPLNTVRTWPFCPLLETFRAGVLPCGVVSPRFSCFLLSPFSTPASAMLVELKLSTRDDGLCISFCSVTVLLEQNIILFFCPENLLFDTVWYCWSRMRVGPLSYWWRFRPWAIESHLKTN